MLKRGQLLIVIFVFLSGVVSATDYYVDAQAGNDENSGTSQSNAWKTLGKVNDANLQGGDRVLFRQGQEFHGSLRPKSGSSGAYITYSAYGTGNKPKLMNSEERNSLSDWSSAGSNKWRTSWGTQTGVIVFNGGESYGQKKSSESQVNSQGDWHRSGGIITMYSTSNPAEYYNDIEIPRAGHIIDNRDASYNIIENITLTAGAWHGWQSSGSHHNTIRDCDISFIGGGYEDGPGTFGNGIEIWEGGHDILIESNRIWEVYDAALTNQGRSSPQYNIYYRNNIVWNSEYCFEMFLRSSSSQLYDIYFENNICAYSGYGFGHEVRPDPHGWHYIGWGRDSQAQDVYFRNNIFYESTTCGFKTWHSDWSYLTPESLDYNLYYESDGNVFCTTSGDYTMDEFSSYQDRRGTDSHSIAADPAFANINILDFHQTSNSPSVNTGADIGITDDYDGNTRPIGSGYDIGAYEFGGTAPESCTDQGFYCCVSGYICSDARDGTGCGAGETCCASQDDCAPVTYCGDGNCSGEENCSTCPDDCGSCTIDCVHAADKEPCDGCIDLDELVDFIEEWRLGIVSMSELMEAIGLWKEGCP